LFNVKYSAFFIQLKAGLHVLDTNLAFYDIVLCGTHFYCISLDDKTNKNPAFS